VWRGDGAGILGEIKNYRAGGDMPQSLYTPGEDQGNYTLILESILGGYPQGTTLRQMQPEILLAMITSYENIRQRLSNDVRYPCSISNSGGSIPLFTEPGCLACFPMNPDDEAGIFNPTVRDFTKIGCVYAPSNLFVRPIISMFNLLGMNTQQWRFLTAEAASGIDGGLMCPDDQNCLQ